MISARGRWRRRIPAGLRLLAVAVAASWGFADARAAIRPGAPSLCVCNGFSGQTPDHDAFMRRFGQRFRSDDEAQTAWRIYSGVLRCNATVVLGRLADTGAYQNQSGYCVLKDVEPYTIAINDAFLQGAIDRSADILLVSESPAEIMSDDVDLEEAQDDPETNWRVIYNHELAVITSSGRYVLPDPFNPPALVRAGAESAHCDHPRWTADALNNEVVSPAATSFGGAACNVKVWSKLSSAWVVIATPPANGVLSQEGPLSLTYTPNPGFKGVDQYTFQYCARDDSSGRSGCATVNYSVSVR